MAKKDNNRRSAFGQLADALNNLEKVINEEIPRGTNNRNRPAPRRNTRSAGAQMTFEERQALRNRQAQAQRNQNKQGQPPSWRDQAPSAPPTDGYQPRGQQEPNRNRRVRDDFADKRTRRAADQEWQGSMNNPQADQAAWKTVQQQQSMDMRPNTRPENDGLDEERNSYGLSAREFEAMKRRAEANGRSLSAQLSREEQARDEELYYKEIFDAASEKDLQIVNVRSGVDSEAIKSMNQTQALVKEIHREATGPNRRQHVAKAIIWSEILNKPKSKR